MIDAAPDYPSSSTYRRRFGSWNAAKEQARLDTIGQDEVPRSAAYTDAELLDLLRQPAAEMRGTLTEDAMNAAPGLPEFVDVPAAVRFMEEGEAGRGTERITIIAGE